MKKKVGMAHCSTSSNNTQTITSSSHILPQSIYLQTTTGVTFRPMPTPFFSVTNLFHALPSLPHCANLKHTYINCNLTTYSTLNYIIIITPYYSRCMNLLLSHTLHPLHKFSNIIVIIPLYCNLQIHAETLTHCIHHHLCSILSIHTSLPNYIRRDFVYIRVIFKTDDLHYRILTLRGYCILTNVQQSKTD